MKPIKINYPFSDYQVNLVLSNSRWVVYPKYEIAKELMNPFKIDAASYPKIFFGRDFPYKIIRSILC
jgi:hypothetical protein